jgi:basic amino acid/polyamine antiporter, APA family
VLVLWRRRQLKSTGPRESRWIFAAALALAYCVWVFIGMGAKPFFWALALSAAGIPVYWWYALRRETVPAAGT